MSSATAKKKKNRKKKNKEIKTDDASQEIEIESNAESAPTSVVAEELTEAQGDLLAALDPSSKKQGLNEAFGDMTIDKVHKFWNTQPVPQHSEDTTTVVAEAMGEIETKTVDMVQKDPYPLPANFEWAECDIMDPKVVKEVYDLLYENYVEDDDNMFRFDYSKEFLQWALTPPGYQKHLHVCVRVATGKQKLVGFITGIPADISACHKKVPMVEINFLCVHKKLRAKRLTPVLIKEVTRRVNLGNVWQAVYTAGVVLPKPVARNRYYHRSLNPKKLIDIGFSRLQHRMTLSLTVKLYKVAKEPQVVGMRKMEKKDIPQAHKLLMEYLKRFSLHQVFSVEEFEHWIFTRENVVYSYVVEDFFTKEITDMISFYSLPSSIIGHPRYTTLKAAYSFYNFSTKTPWKDLMTDALILAKSLNFDVFNALDVMDNTKFLADLKFGIGDGHLQYYLYNWRCAMMEPEKVGLVLL